MKAHYNKSVSLVELLIASTLIILIAVGFTGIDIFSRHHVINAERRVKMQNELAYTLETVNKAVTRGIGDYNNPPLALLANGFQVRVDDNSPGTPRDYGDDTLVNFTLSGNDLKYQVGAGPEEILASHILPGVNFGSLPPNPADGFYIQLSNNDTMLEIALVARWKPNEASSIDNPQVSMKSNISARSSAAK
jgi:hypothetical protein